MTDKDTTYNGWTNYETWNVALWIDNEQGLYNESRERMRELWDEMESPANRNKLITQSQSQATRYHFSVWLKDWVEEMAPDLGATMWADLLGTALSEVNWREIADNWLSEIDGYEAE